MLSHLLVQSPRAINDGEERLVPRACVHVHGSSALDPVRNEVIGPYVIDGVEACTRRGAEWQMPRKNSPLLINPPSLTSPRAATLSAAWKDDEEEEDEAYAHERAVTSCSGPPVCAPSSHAPSRTRAHTRSSQEKYKGVPRRRRKHLRRQSPCHSDWLRDLRRTPDLTPVRVVVGLMREDPVPAGMWIRAINFCAGAGARGPSRTGAGTSRSPAHRRGRGEGGGCTTSLRVYAHLTSQGQSTIP